MTSAVYQQITGNLSHLLQAKSMDQLSMLKGVYL